MSDNNKKIDLNASLNALLNANKIISIIHEDENEKDNKSLSATDIAAQTKRDYLNTTSSYNDLDSPLNITDSGECLIVCIGGLTWITRDTHQSSNRTTLFIEHLIEEMQYVSAKLRNEQETCKYVILEENPFPIDACLYDDLLGTGICMHIEQEFLSECIKVLTMYLDEKELSMKYGSKKYSVIHISMRKYGDVQIKKLLRNGGVPSFTKEELEQTVERIKYFSQMNMPVMTAHQEKYQMRRMNHEKQ